MDKGLVERECKRVFPAQKYGSAYAIMEGAYPVIVISDLDMVADVLSKQFNKFHARRVSCAKIPKQERRNVTALAIGVVMGRTPEEHRRRHRRGMEAHENYSGLWLYYQ